MQILLPGHYPNCTDAVQAGMIFYMAYNLDGVMELNTPTGVISQYKIVLQNGKKADAFRLCRVDSNTLWIGTGLGVYSFDTKTKKIALAKDLPGLLHKPCM